MHEFRLTTLWDNPYALVERRAHPWMWRANWFLFGVLIIAGLGASISRVAPPGSPLRVAGEGVGIAVLIASLIVVYLGPMLFLAGCVTDERRRATADMLALTPYPAVRILIGKAVARLAPITAIIPAGALLLFAGWLLEYSLDPSKAPPISGLHLLAAILCVAAIHAASVAVALDGVVVPVNLAVGLLLSFLCLFLALPLFLLWFWASSAAALEWFEVGPSIRALVFVGLSLLLCWTSFRFLSRTLHQVASRLEFVLLGELPQFEPERDWKGEYPRLGRVVSILVAGFALLLAGLCLVLYIAGCVHVMGIGSGLWAPMLGLVLATTLLVALAYGTLAAIRGCFAQ